MLAACSQKAKITSSWVDPSLEEYGADNILLMGVSRDETRLKLFENIVVDQLSKTDIQAMASYKVIGQTDFERIVELLIADMKKKGVVN